MANPIRAQVSRLLCSRSALGLPAPWLARSIASSPATLAKPSRKSAGKLDRAAPASDQRANRELHPDPHRRHQWETEDDMGASQTAEAGLHTAVLGKGSKAKGKGKSAVAAAEIGDEQLPEGQFDLHEVKAQMGKAVERLRVNLNKVVERVGKLTPRLLDQVMVEVEGKVSPLPGFAAASVRDGQHLVVHCYDPAYIKDVESALYRSSLNLSPLKQPDGSILVAVPKTDNDVRNRLAKDATALCEQTRVAIRAARHAGQKASKTDLDAKRLTKDDHRKDGRQLDEEAKKYSAEVDDIEGKVKKLLLDS